MGRYVVRRLLYMMVVLVVVSFITFGLMHAVPGGPFDAEKALPAGDHEPERALSSGRPLVEQYVDYLYDIMVPRFISRAGSTATSRPPPLLDDFLISFKVGPVWFHWMNFGPSYASRSRTVNDIFRATAAGLGPAGRAWRWPSPW